MPGERTPETSTSSDDDISLREHMQRQIDALRREVLRMDEDQGKYFERVIAQMRDLLDQRFMSQQQAVDELKTTTTQRFESVNEFRAQLNSQQATFISRVESISRHDRSTEMIAAMGQRHDSEIRLLRERTEGEIKQLRDRHDSDMSVVNSRLDLNQGRNTGLDKAWGYIIGAVGLAGAVISIIITTR